MGYLPYYFQGMDMGVLKNEVSDAAMRVGFTKCEKRIVATMLLRGNGTGASILLQAWEQGGTGHRAWISRRRAAGIQAPAALSYPLCGSCFLAAA